MAVRRRWTGAGILVVGVGAVALVAAGLLGAWSQGPAIGGPLSTTASAAVSIPVGAGQPVTWGSVLPENAGTAQIEITRVEALSPTGIDVLEIAVNHPWTEGAVGLVRAFPPTGVTMHPVGGVLLQPGAGPEGDVQVLIGARLAPASVKGTIAGLRVTYSVDGKTYVDVVHDSLTITLAATPSS